ncbi:hypothetical protein DFH08DRAFT_28202 [Mycena albidolilacea]|uniref:Uncharacterized protein n=1 Tax=Mycena albidolilacea TaxID=1033008 RepID=A0AAD7AVI3_9AGAR|nr:hypothetical protein DFH08DRAFT_28202 [Mycena albidolilacea]
MSRNNLHLRSALEIITTSLVERQKFLGRLNPAKGGGVQPVINAIVMGDFNDPNVTFQDVQKAVVGALTAKGGVKVNDVGRALASLYGELSKHHHTGVSEALSLREGEQTLTEAIGAMSIILFARRLYASNFDQSILTLWAMFKQLFHRYDISCYLLCAPLTLYRSYPPTFSPILNAHHRCNRLEYNMLQTSMNRPGSTFSRDTSVWIQMRLSDAGLS